MSRSSFLTAVSLVLTAAPAFTQTLPEYWAKYNFTYLATGPSLSKQCGEGELSGNAMITGPYFGGEIAHAALLGKANATEAGHRGKVLLFRILTPVHGVQLWNPASPGETENADPGFFPPLDPGREVIHNIFCAGHSFDGGGDLVLGGGARGTINECKTWCNQTEPNHSYVFDSSTGDPALNWTGSVPMLVAPGVPNYGHYYPSLIARHDGTILSVGGTTAPYQDPPACPPHPLGTPLPSVNSDESQIFNKGMLRWDGISGSPNLPFPGLPGPLQFTIYPLLHLTSDRHVVCSVAVNSEVTPQGQISHSAFAREETWPPAAGWQMISRPANPSGYINHELTTLPTNMLYPTAILFPWIEGDQQSVVGGDRIIVLGGVNANVAETGSGQLAENAVWELKKQNPTDLDWSNAQWTRNNPWPPMLKERIYANAVILPDMTMIVFGGSKYDFHPYRGLNPPPALPPEKVAQPVYELESIDLLNPTAGWQLLTPQFSPRLYHSIAMILPDGRILVAGGYYPPPDPALNLAIPGAVFWDAEIFTPPCLQEALPRPQILGDSPPILGYGQDFQLTIALDGFAVPSQQIDSAVLIRCPSVTHHFNWDQKVIKLGVRSTPAENRVVFRGLPAHSSTSSTACGDYVAPPGYYLLFVVSKPQGVNGRRVPSIARYVKVQP
jgi:hypothetical protein